jgi:hypothetical protein
MAYPLDRSDLEFSHQYPGLVLEELFHGIPVARNSHLRHLVRLGILEICQSPEEMVGRIGDLSVFLGNSLKEILQAPVLLADRVEIDKIPFCPPLPDGNNLHQSDIEQTGNPCAKNRQRLSQKRVGIDKITDFDTSDVPDECSSTLLSHRQRPDGLETLDEKIRVNALRGEEIQVNRDTVSQIERNRTSPGKIERFYQRFSTELFEEGVGVGRKGVEKHAMVSFGMLRSRLQRLAVLGEIRRLVLTTRTIASGEKVALSH